MARKLEPAQMKSSVHVDDLTSAERKRIARDRHDGSGYVVGLAPAPDGCEAFGDEAVVFRAHRSSHIRFNDPRPELEDLDVVLGQAIGEELGHHGQARLGDAVLPAVW